MDSPAVRIDMERYERKAHFDYFSSLAYPYVGLTHQVDVTGFLSRAKAAGRPFFLSFLWCAARAANGVPELRQRIDGGALVEYANCPTSHTVAREDGTYAYCTLQSDMPLERFLPYARQTQDEARASGGLGGDSLSMLFISTLPWLSYTALVQPVPCPADSNPRITWGRYERQGERVLMPVSILCHHAIVDGLHIARFYEALDEYLAREDQAS